jgi:hypothetical protein
MKFPCILFVSLISSGGDSSPRPIYIVPQGNVFYKGGDELTSLIDTYLAATKPT